MLIARDITFAHPGNAPLLNDVSFSIETSERIALVGENGAGKSTLLHILTRLLTPDSGTIQVQNKCSVGILRQTPELDPNATVEQITEGAFASLIEAIQQHKELCDTLEETKTPTPGQLERLESLTQDIEKSGGFAWQYRIDEVLARFSIRSRDQHVSSLSGGERRRLDLARLILQQPDLLLLDEPTNHLDTGAIRYLADTLKDQNATTLFITHDRAFLDDVSTKIVELEAGSLYTHAPPYENFLESRLVRREIDARSAHRRERLWARELAWLRAGVKARTTKQKARISRAEDLMVEVSNDVHQKRDALINVQKAKSQRLGRTILEFKDARLKRGDKHLFADWTFLLTKGERWGIIGNNGCGKTSLLRAIQGTLPLESGELVIGKNTQIGVLDQHREALEPEKTLGDILCEDGDHVHLGEQSIHIASYLERFLFSGKDRYRPVKTLSGGEQNRLHLARLFLQNANVLLLDEPTNDLDITTLGVLEDLLLELDGVALIVSHDKHFLDRVCTGILAFEPTPAGQREQSSICALQGDYTHYMHMRGDLLLQKGSSAATERSAPAAEDKPTQTQASGQSSSRARKRTYKEDQEYQSIEETILKSETRCEELRAILEDPEIYKNDPQGAQAYAEELSTLETKVEQLYERWQELEELRP